MRRFIVNVEDKDEAQNYICYWKCREDERNPLDLGGFGM
jgi:hypothetical protein